MKKYTLFSLMIKLVVLMIILLPFDMSECYAETEIEPYLETGKTYSSEEIPEVWYAPYAPQMDRYRIIWGKYAMISYSSSETSMDAAIDVLFGERNPQGKLPITISEKYPIGFGLSMSGETVD